MLICDEEYPQRVAYTYILKAMDDFITRFPKDKWNLAPFPEMQELRASFDLYQDPKAADSLSQIQGDLDETKVCTIFKSLLRT